MDFKELRKASGISQSELAGQLGDVTQGAVSQWENGVCSPQLSKVARIASVLRKTSQEVIAALEESANGSTRLAESRAGATCCIDSDAKSMEEQA